MPDRQTYYFQDESDYYLNKALHSADPHHTDQEAPQGAFPAAIEYCADAMTQAFCTSHSEYKCKEGADWHDTQAYRDSLLWCRENSR